MKTCSRCKEAKTVDHFCKNASAKDGLQPARKQCMAISWNTSRNKKHVHYKEVQKKREAKTKAAINEWKRKQGCKLCPETEPAALDLHHVDPSQKDSDPSDLLRVSEAAFFREAAKCVVLCANCHRKVHAGILNLGFA